LRYVYLYFFNPWFLKKCYWIIVGGDLYYYKTRPINLRHDLYEFMRKSVISKIAYLITGTTGDYKLAQKWYGATGKHIKCFNYPSNLYKEYEIKPKKHNTINIQLGNSADPSNNHIDVLKNLEQYKDEDIQIFVPLSYGDQEYAKEIILKGKELFGDKFIPLTEFMPFEKYLDFLSEIDIAIFAHKRQQAMGNTITLLGLGKKVYIDSGTVQFDFFKKNNVEVFDVNSINLQTLNQTTVKTNKEKIKNLFSKKVLLDGLQRIFND
ncbi:MAG: TDP-N-acetylfucosamine:lipid II N-acetylfucosaminyltransferase, partial [Campylobacterota bacterium]|nr:TDP-N-acetylfucosamine:lipid II N-acetylfucosaminyltransferase [Campylobacterota bacterium]